MKTWKEQALDKLYVLWHKKIFYNPMPKFPKKRFPRIESKLFRHIFKSELDNGLSHLGFELSNGDIWIRRRSPVFVDKLWIDQSTKYLPTMLSINSRAGIHCQSAFQFYACLIGKPYKITDHFWLEELSDTFPRMETSLSHNFHLESFSSEKAVNTDIKQVVQVIAQCADRYFNQFQCLEDAIPVLERLITNDRKRGCWPDEQDVFLGILYFLSGEKGRAITCYESAIQSIELFLVTPNDSSQMASRQRIAVMKRGLEMMRNGKAGRLVESFGLPSSDSTGSRHGP